MDWTRIERKWDKFAVRAKAEWTKLTDEDVRVVAGKKDLLVAKVQEQYGVPKEDAERQVDGWFAKLVARRAELAAAKNGAAR